jgi:hypothetical protein
MTLYRTPSTVDLVPRFNLTPALKAERHYSFFLAAAATAIGTLCFFGGTSSFMATPSLPVLSTISRVVEALGAGLPLGLLLGFGVWALTQDSLGRSIAIVSGVLALFMLLLLPGHLLNSGFPDLLFSLDRACLVAAGVMGLLALGAFYFALSAHRLAARLSQGTLTVRIPPIATTAIAHRDHPLQTQ